MYHDINLHVDRFFQTFISPSSPGGVVIVLQDGQIIHQTAYGLAHLAHHTKNTVNHAFHLASMSKQMTALAIMQLAQQGKLHYDDLLSTHIPELTTLNAPMTIRHLLTHTAGLPDYDDGISDALSARADEPTNADMVAVVSQACTLVAQPGDMYYYSNVGYDLLAVVIERTSGNTFPAFMHTHIFDVLQMTHTFSMPNPRRMTQDLIALSYTGGSHTPTPVSAHHLDGIYGSGSVYSTIGDMALYDEALYGNKLVAQDRFQEAYTPIRLNNGNIAPYGFGLELADWHGEAYTAHSGSWLGFISDYVRFPKRHFSVIVLLNRDYDYPDDPRIALKVAEFYLK